jgi:hypothetical protein
LRFGTRPGHFFGGIGLAVMSVGMAILGYLGVLKLLGESVGGRPLLQVGFFSLMAGLQFLTTGVLAEIMTRVYFDDGHARQYHVMPQEPLADDAAWHQ